MTTDTVGDTTASMNFTGYLWAQKIQATASGVLQTIGVNVHQTDSADARLALYSHDAGNDRPNSLLAEVGSFAVATGWNDKTPDALPSIVQGTYYWLVLQQTGGVAVPYTGNVGRWSYKSQSFGAFPSTWPSGSSEGTDSDQIGNMRITYAPTTTSQIISQNARLKVSGQTQTLSQNATVQAVSQALSQNARIRAVGQTQTLSQNAAVQSTIRTLSQNAAIQAVSKTLSQNTSVRPPSETIIGNCVLPHVLTLTIAYEVVMAKKPIENGVLPYCKMVGGKGRSVQVAGWTDQQADIDMMEALMDGTIRIFYHPSGQQYFRVLVTDFRPSEAADRWNRRTYDLKAAETAE